MAKNQRTASQARKLGRNLGQYGGETIDIQQVLHDALQAGQKMGWQSEVHPLSGGFHLINLRRSVNDSKKNVYLSTGIHGDEPAGPLAIHQLIQEDVWPKTASLWLCPCLNPSGFAVNRRENAQGIDLNRDYRHLTSEEIRAHVAWLARQPQFDYTFCMHEDWEAQGFYLYELNPDHQPSPAAAMIEAVSQVCPIDHSPIIDDRPAQNGIIRPDLDPAKRPKWPEAFYLFMNHTRHSFTLEAPSDFPLAVRVKALVTAVRTAMSNPGAGDGMAA